MLQIHEKIKQARLSANLTEEELAKKIGVKRSTYQYWEVVTPSVAKIKEVAKALGKHEDYFFTNDENFVDNSYKDDQKKVEDKEAMKIISDLTESVKSLAESNAILARNNEVLVNRVSSGAAVSAPLPGVGVRKDKWDDSYEVPLSGKIKSGTSRKRKGTLKTVSK